MKKCLIIVSEYPFPSRNGVTIPTSNYIELLYSLDYHIDLIVINNEINQEELPSSKFIQSSYLLKSKRNKLKAYLQELTLQIPFFNNYTYNKEKVKEIIHTQGPYDTILASPINVTEVATFANKIHQDFFKKKAFSIAGISDCYTTVLRNNIDTKELTLKTKIQFFIKKIRSYLMPILEYKALKAFDNILVQTKKDENELNKFTKNQLASKIKIVTNGVHNDLFKIQNQPNTNFLYVATLKSLHYQKNLLWLYNNVWKKLTINNPEYKLYIYTGGTFPEKIFEEMMQDKSIIVTNEFVKDIKDIYINKTICFAPIFKNNGFMNKVAEAMSAGLIVIGDSSAFNGILHYKNHKNVIIANTPEEVIQSVNNIIHDHSKLLSLSSEAQALAQIEFQWKNKINVFKRKDTNETLVH